MIVKWIPLLLVLFCFQGAFATSLLNESINLHQKEYEEVALKIWDLAEVGYQEYKSSKLLQESLRKKGFKVKEVPSCELAREDGFSRINLWKMGHRYIWRVIINLF